MSRQVPLTKGAVALVDDEDFEELAALKWHLHPGGYAVRHTSWVNGYRKLEYMHRRLLGEDVPRVDHVNGDKLDNRRANLRPATRQQNAVNRASRKSKWGYAGVRYDGRAGLKKRWGAYTVIDRRKTYIGYFATAEEAAHAYDDFMRLVHAGYATLNFPREGERGFEMTVTHSNVPNPPRDGCPQGTSVPTSCSETSGNAPKCATPDSKVSGK